MMSFPAGARIWRHAVQLQRPPVYLPWPARGHFVWPVNRDGRVHLTQARCWTPDSEALSRWPNITAPGLLREHHGTRQAI